VPEPTEQAWKVERLGGGHDRASFDCGKPPLNEWLQRFAGQYERRDLARTYVAVREGNPRVLGYYAISNHLVRYDALPDEQAKGLPTIDIPVILLGRLAVDKTAQGQGLGQHLLIDALRRAVHISEHIGVRAVEVDAIDDGARQFYLKFGFVPLLDDQDHLFLPMQVIRKLALPPM
jgi:GNAT superfamily N-acetyltransferase